MANEWLAVALSTGVVLLAGQRQWERHQRRQRHARVAARRLQGQVRTELARLDQRNEALQEQIRTALGASALADPEAYFGPDLLADFYRIVLSELQVWAEEADEELDGLRGRRLASRRADLRALKAEIEEVCREIEAHQAKWASALAHSDEGVEWDSGTGRGRSADIEAPSGAS
jgi:hypothetical protein